MAKPHKLLLKTKIAPPHALPMTAYSIAALPLLDPTHPTPRSLLSIHPGPIPRLPPS